MTRQRFAWASSLAAILLVTAACTRDEAPDDAMLTDAAITTRVQAEYFGDSTVKAFDVDVDTEDGVVTLSGTVETEAARARAAELAQQVDGVRRVQNDLRVEPPMTAQAREPAAAVGGTPVGGVAGAPADPDAPDRDPAGLPDAGAGTITPTDPRGIAAEHATPSRPAGRPDADAQADAEARDDAGPDADRVTDAMANLDERINAGWITMKIQAQYFTEDAVKGRRIDVDTSQAGVVTLQGEVETEAARQRAVEIARTTEGVANVIDELTVAGESGSALAEAEAEDAARGDGLALELSDTWITAKIESKYFLDEDVKGRDIEVTTQDGVVTLRGEVHSPAERRQAVTLARGTDGVADVRDELRVMEPVAVGAEPGSAETREAGRAITPVTDEWIETRIQSRYFLDSELKFGDLDVSSEGGTVIIQGEVPSEQAKETAEAIARETSGVTEVDSRLVVAGEAAPSATEAPAGQ
jgi:osmotically-inducible protein OsmY